MTTTTRTVGLVRPTVDEDLDFALTLAAVGAGIGLERQGRPDLVIETKVDGSPVTDADHTVERELRRMIARWRPHDAILGEEFGATAGNNDRRWIIDPIDGTANFVAGSPEWAVLVALEIAGMVVVGIMAAPVLGVTWWAARDRGAHRNGERIQVRHESDRGLVVSRRANHQAGADALPAAMNAIVASAAVVDATATFWPELLVAEGIVDIDCSPQAGALWDLAPRQIIVEEAGGHFSDFGGRHHAAGGSSLSCSSGPLQQAMLGKTRFNHRTLDRGVLAG